MANPWLSVALADYEGHMNSPQVQQLEALTELFARVLTLRKPESVAILGIAGGNGLRAIDSKVTKRVVGFDINPAYLYEVQQRYAHVAGLELHCVDLTVPLVGIAPAALVHAALVFEHAGAGTCLDNALSLVKADGALSVVLQLPSETEAVTPSPFASMQNLKAHITMVEPRELCQTLEKRGLGMIHEKRRELPKGKTFWMGIFTKAQRQELRRRSESEERDTLPNRV